MNRPDSSDDGQVRERVEAALRAAVSAQREGARPHHDDFYGWGATLTVMLDQLRHCASVLGDQVNRYGVGRELYDDGGLDPDERVDRSVIYLELLTRQLADAATTARRYHSEMSHLGVKPEE